MQKCDVMCSGIITDSGVFISVPMPSALVNTRMVVVGILQQMGFTESLTSIFLDSARILQLPFNKVEELMLSYSPIHVTKVVGNCGDIVVLNHLYFFPEDFDATVLTLPLDFYTLR